MKRVKFMLASAALAGCSLFRQPFTADEAKCLAEVDAREDVELVACGKDTSGACSTDEIMDRYDIAAESCVRGAE